jgi:hypothetical protein
MPGGGKRSVFLSSALRYAGADGRSRHGYRAVDPAADCAIRPTSLPAMIGCTRTLRRRFSPAAARSTTLSQMKNPSIGH